MTPRHVTEAGLGRGSSGRPTTSLHDARLGATTQSSLHPGGEVQLFGVQKLETAGLMFRLGRSLAGPRPTQGAARGTGLGTQRQYYLT